MPSEHELFLELKSARLDARHAAEEAADAKSTWLAKREALRKAQAVVEEILEEIETGKSRYPMMDRTAAQAHEGAPPSTLADGVEPSARSGFDLVTSRPGSIPETNGLPAAQPEPKPRRKKTRT